MPKSKESKEKMTKKIKKAYIESLKNGTTRAKAAEAAGVVFKTIWEWTKEDEQFAKEVEAALESRINVAEDALYEEATGESGKYKVIALIFWLKNRGKGKWRDKYEHEVTMPKIINQRAFVQAGEEPVIEEDPEPVEKKEDTTGV